MADLKIPVKTTKDFVFNPTLLIITPAETNLQTGDVKVTYDLREETPLDATKYELRNWVDSGIVTLPLAVIAQAMSEGNLNIPLVNQILAAFNLEVDTTKL